MAAVQDDEDIKNRIHDNDDFQKLSKIQAATDSKHDLGTDFTTIYTATQNIGTPQESYDAKLEDQGWKVVNQIVQDVKINEIDTGTEKFVPMPYGDKIKIKHNDFEYELTTMNIEYDESKKMENAKALYDFITDEQEVCLILDATTGDFQKIFINAIGATASTISPSDKKKIYYIVNRETISDPAGKPNEKDIDFRTGIGSKNEKRDIEITVALDVSEDKVIYPRWKDARTDFHSDFFSNFTIELTPVQYGVSKIVMLVFTGEDYSNTSIIETSAAGKLTNSVNAMKNVLKKMANKIQEFSAKIRLKSKKTKDDPNTINDYFVTLQKKRSGDALISLSFFDTERVYHLDKSDNFTFKEKSRFVLTHDTFNTLPVSLMNGADVIYTAQSTVYKFKRIRKGEEKRDYTKIFFDKYIKNDAERRAIIEMFNLQNDAYFDRGLDPIVAEIEPMLKKIQPFSVTATRLSSVQIKILMIGITSCLQLFFKLALFRSLYMPVMNIETVLSEVDALSKQDYSDSLKQRIDKIKEVYTVQKIKDNDYTTGFDKFTKTYINNTVYKEIGKFEPFLETNQYTFGKKENKLTFGSSPIIHAFLRKEDGITEFLEIIENIYKNENVFGIRGQKNKAPLNEILSTFLELEPLLVEGETSVETDQLLVAAHEEIGVSFVSSVPVPTFEGTQRFSANKQIVKQPLEELKDRIGDVASISSTIPYHTGISQRVVDTANTLISSLTGLFTGLITVNQTGGAMISEKHKLQFYSFILFNYMVEMNQYFEGEYNDPDLDIYGQTIPMAGKLLLHAMNTSRDIQSLFFFFIKMSYYANDKDSFEKEYSGTLKGNKSLYFLPCIFENILYNAFGPDFLVKFQDFSVKAYPQIMRDSKLRYLIPPRPEMTNPSWLQVEKDIKIKIVQVSRYLEDQPQMTPAGKRVRNWAYDREKVAAIGGVRYKKTRKSSGRKATKSRRHKK